MKLVSPSGLDVSDKFSFNGEQISHFTKLFLPPGQQEEKKYSSLSFSYSDILFQILHVWEHTSTIYVKNFFLDEESSNYWHQSIADKLKKMGHFSVNKSKFSWKWTVAGI